MCQSQPSHPLNVRKDIGLSEGYAAALGEAFTEYCSDMPKTAIGFLLVTHSRPLIRAMLPLDPTFVRVGVDHRPTRQWLAEGDQPKTIDDLKNLYKVAQGRFSAVENLLNERRQSSRSDDQEPSKPRR